MADNEFLLRIVGEDVSPQSVDVDDLTDVIRGFRGAIASIAGEDGHRVFLGLVNVAATASDSETLTLSGSPETLASAQELVRSLASDTTHKLPEKARICLRNIWKSTFRRGWDACEFSGNGSAIGNAAILREKELFPIPGTYRGTTTLYGRCIRAGGERRKTATLKLTNGETLTITLKTTKLAKQLGERLYQVVGLKGEAIWQSSDRSLSDFRADTLTDYTDRDTPLRERSVVEAFDALVIAAGNRWDNVNPDEFVREQRRD